MRGASLSTSEPAAATGRHERSIGYLLCIVVLATVARRWGIDHPGLDLLTVVATLAAIILILPRATPSRRAFVVVGIALLAALYLLQADWYETFERGLVTAAFIAAFFVALSTLGNAAASSDSIRTCGRFLARQPPGRRYGALTVGGQLFSLLLNYGSLPLLGSMVVASAREETNARVRELRMRRMLLAIQRALMSTVPWSPLSYGVAITTVLVPGSSWLPALGPCLVTGVIMALTGWALDFASRPRRPVAARASAPAEGSWLDLSPLLRLLVVIGTSVIALSLATGIDVPGVVIAVVPVISAGWIVLQDRGAGSLPRLGGRTRQFVEQDLPRYASELLLLMMAGFIGVLGGAIVGPLVKGSGIDLSGFPPGLVLASLVWLIPAAGQIGMNPILAAGLIVPLLPSTAEMGVSPTAVFVAITAGWALGGISSPFTATTVLVGAYSGVSARTVGVIWNGLYMLVTPALLSVWVVVYATVLT